MMMADFNLNVEVLHVRSSKFNKLVFSLWKQMYIICYFLITNIYCTFFLLI